MSEPEISRWEEKILSRQIEIERNSSKIMCRGMTFARQVFIELLAIDADAPAQVRHGSVRRTEQFQVFCEIAHFILEK
jgi:hypothetical protein